MSDQEIDDGPATHVRLYGRSFSDPDSEIVDVIYCGFKAGIQEVRLPTARVFHINRAEILASGDVAGYEVDGETVSYYDLQLSADVYESKPQKVSLGAEIVKSTGGTFASLVATAPDASKVIPTGLEQLSRDELLARAREGATARLASTLEEGGSSEGQFACNTYRQSYSWTWGFLGPRPDPWGADCD